MWFKLIVQFVRAASSLHCICTPLKLCRVVEHVLCVVVVDTVLLWQSPCHGLLVDEVVISDPDAGICWYQAGAISRLHVIFMYLFHSV